MPPTAMARPIAAATAALDHALRTRISRDLPGALGRGELALHYQPRIRLRDGARTGAEALLRWQHPRHGAIPPGTFIPMAEGSDLIVALGGWVLREAAREAARRPSAGRVAVNVSVRQVAAGALPAQVEAALGASGLPPERLELELTESLLLREDPGTGAMLGRLRDQGIGLALDDFGTGYASLARLRRLPFDTLKLDGSFIANLPGDPAEAAILDAVAALARALRLTLVAEGVERPAQRAAVTAAGCDEAQGYLFGAAVPADMLWGAVPLAAARQRPRIKCLCPSLESPSSAPALPASPAPAP